jgi:hypothetical protein
MCMRVIGLLRPLSAPGCDGVALSRRHTIVRLHFAIGESLLFGNRPLAVAATVPLVIWVHFTTRTSVVVGLIVQTHSLLAKHCGTPGVRKVN